MDLTPALEGLTGVFEELSGAALSYVFSKGLVSFSDWLRLSLGGLRDMVWLRDAFLDRLRKVSLGVCL